MKQQILGLFNKRKRINEFEDLQNQFWDKLTLYSYHIKKHEVVVVKDDTICRGEFGCYSIYIPQDYLFFSDLKKITGYRLSSISKMPIGFKITVVSDRIKNEVQENKKNEIKWKRRRKN